MSLVNNFPTSNPVYNIDFKLCGSASTHSSVILTRRPEDWGQDSPSHRCVSSPRWQIAPRALTALSRQSMGRAGSRNRIGEGTQRRSYFTLPDRLDEAVSKVEGGWPILIRNMHHIGGFIRWERFDDYQMSWRGYHMISQRNLQDRKSESNYWLVSVKRQNGVERPTFLLISLIKNTNVLKVLFPEHIGDRNGFSVSVSYKKRRTFSM